jgi:hypothetical protein
MIDLSFPGVWSLPFLVCETERGISLFYDFRFQGVEIEFDDFVIVFFDHDHLGHLLDWIKTIQAQAVQLLVLRVP